MRTQQETNIIKAEINTLMKYVNDDKKLDNIFYLKGRWNDEKEYEDFNEYIEVMKKHFETSSFKFQKMTKTFKVTVKNEVTKHSFTVSFNWSGITVQAI